MIDKLKQANQSIEELSDQKKVVAHEAIAKISDLDKQIRAVQASTKTTFAVFISIHNYLRMHLGWYYSWHTKSYANNIHLLIFYFTLVLISLLIINGYVTDHS